MSTALTYQDVYLIPQRGILPSRSLANLSVEFLGRTFAAPWIPANMETVISEDVAKWLAFNNYPYIMHRFGDTRKFLQKTRAEAWPFVSISVGVKDEDKQLIKDIFSSKCRVDWVTIDIAHGHSLPMKQMIAFIRELLPNIKIIAGNVATQHAVRDLELWGADAAKIGVGGGKACTTKDMTGFHIPMFSCVQGCVSELYVDGDAILRRGNMNFPIIADGGVRENGDIAKALVAAGTAPCLVMAGSLFAACLDAPGETICEQKMIVESNYGLQQIGVVPDKDKPLFKLYHGSASHIQKGEKKHVEGIQVKIPCNGMTYPEKYKELTESLSSSISYAGGQDLSCFRYVRHVSLK